MIVRKRKVLIIIFFLLLLYGFIYAISFVDLSFVKGEIVEYSLSCKSELKNGLCTTKPEFALRRTTYKPNVSGQYVLYWVEGFDISKLNDCAVKNRNNWACTFNDRSAKFGFTGGTYFNYILQKETMPDRSYSVSKPEWLIQSCRDSWISWSICPIIVNINN